MKQGSKIHKVANGFSYCFLGLMVALMAYAYQAKVPHEPVYTDQDRAEMNSLIATVSAPEMPRQLGPTDSTLMIGSLPYEQKLAIVQAYLLEEEAR